MIEGQRVCVVDIKRSAKNYWEYRAIIKVGDETRPSEIYNCRDRIRWIDNDIWIPFKSQGVEDWICRVLRQ